MFASKVHNLRHFGLRDFISEYTAFTDSMVVNMQHNPSCCFPILVEETFKNMNHELHGRVVVV